MVFLQILIMCNLFIVIQPTNSFSSANEYYDYYEDNESGSESGQFDDINTSEENPNYSTTATSENPAFKDYHYTGSYVTDKETITLDYQDNRDPDTTVIEDESTLNFTTTNSYMNINRHHHRSSIVAYSTYSNSADLQTEETVANTTETTTIYNKECMRNLTYVHINSNPINQELEVTWDTNPLDECSYEYRITKIEMSGSQTTMQSLNINKTSYTFQDVKPCTKYNITVEMFLDYTEIAKKSEIFETESIVFNKIDNLEISASINSISLSWKPPEFADICKIGYKIYVNKEIPYYRYIKGTKHLIKNLNSCTKYKVSVTPSSMVRNEYDDDNSHVMEHTVSTLPRKVRNLNLRIYNNKSLITWLPPENIDCIAGYRVHIIRSDWNWTIDTINTYVDKDENIFCTEIVVNAITSDGNIGEPAFLLKPGPVNNLIDSFIADTYITIKWETPRNNFCVNNYTLHKNSNFIYYTTDNEYTFINLTSCTSYLFEVAANSRKGVSSEFEEILITTSPPKEIDLPENLHVTVEKDDIDLSWEPPANAMFCSNKYLVQVFDANGNIIYHETTLETYHQIRNISWIGCENYTIKVNSAIEMKEGKVQETILEIPKVTKPPICMVSIKEQTSATITCELDRTISNVCELLKATIACIALEDENNGNWIKWYSSQEITNVTVSFEVFVGNLSEFTNYSCSVKILNTAGWSNPSELIKFQTNEGIPDSPLFTSVAAITSRSIDIQWSKPKSIRGILQGYRLTILTIQPKYFIPNTTECPIINKTNTIILPSTTKYTFLEALPKYEYEICIQALSRAGISELNTIKTTTLAETPEEARNVDFYIGKRDLKNYDVNVSIIWSYPCYTYGRIKDFQLKLSGAPFADLNNTNHEETKIINIKEDLMYNHTFTNLKAAYNYTIYVSVIPAEANLGNSQTSIEFSSPESFPEAPAVSTPIGITENSVVLAWEEPKQKNGIIRKYKLNLVNNGPEYFVPNDEECQKPIQNYSYYIPPSQNSFEFKEGTPYHTYEACVIATNNAGDGEPSKLINILTLESEPETVRWLTHELQVTKSEVYNASVTINFKHPCNTYGLFDKIVLKVIGIRQLYSSHTETVEIQEEKKEYEVELNSLQPEYNYSISIKILTKTHESGISEFEFSTPSGVPPGIENIVEPVPYEPTKANYTLKKNMFNSTYGKILYYAFIIGTVDKTEHSKFGFWDGNENSWPKIKNAKGMTVPYQATENFWNPFNDLEENETAFYTFTFGDTSIFKSNKPLEAGVTYTLKVRGFTSNGYRDSPTVKFEMPGTFNAPLIFGLIFGIISTGILLGVVFILWKRKREWRLNKESIKSSIPMTPMPLSIAAFQLHYIELTNNSDKLTQEYTLLGTMSNEITLTMVDGLLPENKKKNRYTNVIPYDQTRVRLVDIDDDASTTDYINASYVQGYSNNIEYIATQGPLEHTCIDFWKMIMQENVSLIIMVAQFVEQNKNKCHKYFPNNHENIELENGICIRCCTELDFNTYIVRTLLVQKDLQQWTITHLQFIDWPDFGCPTSSEVVLEFSQIIREHADKENAPIVVHCSAGVGRTGTLIALDILLQTINQGQDIDIFGTVLNLRRDRKNMVQTEKQYLFIYSCVNDALENSTSTQTDDSLFKEPIYENVNDIKRDYEDMDESKF